MPSHFAGAGGRGCPVEVEHLKRFALVTGNYVNVVDGVTLTLHRLVETLESVGVEVVVVAPDGVNQELDGASNLIPIPSLALPIQKGYRLSLGFNPWVTSALDEFSPQVVHVATPDLTGWMATRYARRRQLVLTGTYHTNFATYLKYWGVVPSVLTPVAWHLLKRFYAPFDQVFVPTDSLGQDLVNREILAHYGVLARGVDHDRFHQGQRGPRWRLRYGIGQEELVVLFCARLVWEKGLRTLVAGLRRLQEIGPPHRVMVVGDGDQKRWMERQLPEATFTGYLSGDDLARAYANADLFLYPSTTDTFGNVTLEAMASHLPVIGAYAPGTRTLVEPEESGVLVEPDDPEALAQAAALVLEDAAYRKQLAIGAGRRAKEFRWPEILGGFISEVDEIVGDRALAQNSKP